MAESLGIGWWMLATGVLALVIQCIISIITALKTRRTKQKVMGQFPGPPPHWLYGNKQDVSYSNDISSLYLYNDFLSFQKINSDQGHRNNDFNMYTIYFINCCCVRV